jgi:hypothetical protein
MYRIKEFDPLHDMWILQKKVFWFIWKPVSLGTKKELEKFIKDQSNASN